jgi:hypothetical protein
VEHPSNQLPALQISLTSEIYHDDGNAGSDHARAYDFTITVSCCSQVFLGDHHRSRRRFVDAANDGRNYQAGKVGRGKLIG